MRRRTTAARERKGPASCIDAVAIVAPRTWPIRDATGVAPSAVKAATREMVGSCILSFGVGFWCVLTMIKKLAL